MAAERKSSFDVTDACDLTAEEYREHRTREKGYAMIALILHLIPAVLPAMALSVFYTAAPYILAFFPLIVLVLILYRAPMEAAQITETVKRNYVQFASFLILTARILAILTPALLIYANFRLDLGISIWLIIQIVCLLLEGLALQFLFRHRRKLRYS